MSSLRAQLGILPFRLVRLTLILVEKRLLFLFQLIVAAATAILLP